MILTVQAAALSISFCLADAKGNLFAHYPAKVFQQNTIHFLEELQGFLNRAKVTLDQINTVVYSHGPGGFTGIRILLINLIGLFYQKKVFYYGISSLKALDKPKIVPRESVYYFLKVLPAGRTQAFCELLELHVGKPSFTIQPTTLLEWSALKNLIQKYQNKGSLISVVAKPNKIKLYDQVFSFFEEQKGEPHWALPDAKPLWQYYWVNQKQLKPTSLPKACYYKEPDLG